MKKKCFTKLSRIVSYLIGIIYAIIVVLIPLLMLFINVVFYFSIAFLIPELIYIALKNLNLFDFLTIPTVVYLKITLTVFLSVLLNSFLRCVVYHLSPRRIYTSKKLKPYEFRKRTDDLLSIDNIRFIVYVFYVVTLLISNYFNFQGDSICCSVEIDKPILQSFVTFIAFDCALALMKQLNFKPLRFVRNIFQSILYKIKNDKTDEKS